MINYLERERERWWIKFKTENKTGENFKKRERYLNGEREIELKKKRNRITEGGGTKKNFFLFDGEN